MESGLISASTGNKVYLASGVVELIDAKTKKRTKSRFSNVMVQGDTDDERRRSFKYEKAFPWEARKRVRELQDAGLVVLLELNVGRCLGLAKGDHPVPASVDINDEYI